MKRKKKTQYKRKNANVVTEVVTQARKVVTGGRRKKK